MRDDVIGFAKVAGALLLVGFGAVFVIAVLIGSVRIAATPSSAAPVESVSPSGLTLEASVFRGPYLFQRWHDADAGVTCWLYTNGGVSCLPDSAVRR